MTVEGELVDRVGVRLHPTRDDTATIPVSVAVVRDGEILVSAMTLAADIASGIRLHEPGVARVLTTSFSLRRASTTYVGPVTAVSTPLFAHDKRFVDQLEFRGEEGEVVATGRISFVVRLSDATQTRDTRSRYLAPWTQPINEPLIDAAGIEIADAAIGRVKLRATSGVQREGGILQGAFVTLLGEASALALAEEHYGTPAVVESLDVDYLAGVGAEAVATEARWLDGPGNSDIEVVLRSEPAGSPLAVFTVGVARANSR
jgi:acyl-coenzyme A thioesterase PaaI-like protein